MLVHAIVRVLLEAAVISAVKFSVPATQSFKEARCGDAVFEPASKAAEIINAVESTVNSIRDKSCPGSPHLKISVREPCEVQMLAGEMESCWMEFGIPGGAPAVRHKVHAMHLLEGGMELYIELPEEAKGALEKQRWCDIILDSSDVSLHPDSNKSFLQSAAWGWVGHEAELEFMRRLNGSHEAFITLSPSRSDYGQDLPLIMPIEWSARTGFDSGKPGARSSQACFPKEGSTVVLNQGECGSCWAAAASGAISDRMCFAGVRGLASVDQGRPADRTLSVQHVMSCGSIEDGCKGGEITAYFQHGASHGLAKRSEWPYQMKCPKMQAELPHGLVAPKEYGINCAKFKGTKLDHAPSLSSTPCICLQGRIEQLDRQPPCDMGKVTELYKIDSFSRTPFVGETVDFVGSGRRQFTVKDAVNLFKEELYMNGPFSVGFHVYDDLQQQIANPYFPKQIYIKFPHASYQGRHAATLLGWGQRLQQPYPWQCVPAYNFMNNMSRFYAAFPLPDNAGMPITSSKVGYMPSSAVPDHVNYMCAPAVVPYWELRNSWGSRHGDQGHFYMRRGYNEVGLESAGFVPHISIETAGPFPNYRSAPVVHSQESPHIQSVASWIPRKQDETISNSHLNQNRSGGVQRRHADWDDDARTTLQRDVAALEALLNANRKAEVRHRDVHSDLGFDVFDSLAPKVQYRDIDERHDAVLEALLKKDVQQEVPDREVDIINEFANKAQRHQG